MSLSNHHIGNRVNLISQASHSVLKKEGHISEMCRYQPGFQVRPSLGVCVPRDPASCDPHTSCFLELQ